MMMSSLEIENALVNALSKPGCMITYRSLSRKLSIHVEAAKSAMAGYYEKHNDGKRTLYATYWMSGTLAQSQTNGDHEAMDVDGTHDIGATVSRVCIVRDDILEGAKAAFAQVHSEHVYSLSTFKVEDDSQMCSAWREVRNCDKEGGGKLAKAVGKITSQDVEPIAVKKQPKLSSQSLSAKPSTSKMQPAKPVKNEESQKGTKPEVSAKKGPAKLDWSKAKSREAPQTEALKTVKNEESPKSSQQRGTKRKSSPLLSKPLDEEAVQKTETPNVAEIPPSSVTGRVTKRVIMSDDEDEELTKRQSRIKKNMKARATDDDLRALMDVDDSEVTRASKAVKGEPKQAPPPSPASQPNIDDATASGTADGKVVPDPMEEDSDDPAPKAKPRKRKEKKVIPVGRNGLKKKRVVKSKTDFDEKGYMVTVDYSSYESVDEDEAEEAIKPPLKLASSKSTSKPSVATAKKADGKKSLDRSSSMNKGKTATGSGGQKTIGSFFGGKAKG